MDQVWEMQVRLVASNRIGSEIIETEHGKSEIKFYGNSFIQTGPTGEIVSYFVMIKRKQILLLNLIWTKSNPRGIVGGYSVIGVQIYISVIPQWNKMLGNMFFRGSYNCLCLVRATFHYYCFALDFD
ncbi:uncharacterized protein LOC131599964 isoform X1 [Vicia villosa]|uniref:uncharacterized protein LOC131599964 isoform X1 n=1 Tax=Vicia villosa TaxID=3911 RepID=UPI00273C046D|nr:uncharacterized protein LOC131599964 isoform X1 [Vicia villosa]